MHREKNEKPQVQNWSTAPASLKILFFHNTLPEYRIGWFCNLDKIANVDFVFTNEELNKKDYGFEIELEKAKGLRCTFLSDGVAGFIELVRLEPGNVELMKNALECSMDEAIKESAIQKDAELFNEFNYINMAKKYIDAIVN